MKRTELTIEQYEVLGMAYHNLIEAGMLLDTIDYDDFVEAVLTGDTFDFEEANKAMNDWLIKGKYND